MKAKEAMGYERVFTQLNNTKQSPQSHKRAANNVPEQIEALIGIKHVNRINTAVASSCYSSNHVFTPQLPKPTGLPSYSQINCSNFTPANFSLNFLVASHLICPQLLSSRDTLDLACAIFQYLFITCLLYLCLNGYLSVSWGTNGETRCGEKSLSCFSPPLSISVILSLHLAWALFMLCGVAVTSGEAQATGGKSFRLHLGSNSPCSISARVWPED